MKRGFWNIPVPAKQEPLKPDILIAPLVGWDKEKFRLGYGGGYFDRTLTTFEGKRFVIGVYLNDKIIAEAEGDSKQEAEEKSARQALKLKHWED